MHVKLVFFIWLDHSIRSIDFKTSLKVAANLRQIPLFHELYLTHWGRQNRRHFPDDSFKWIFLNENVWNSIEVSLKFVPKGPINNIPALVQVMAWRRPGDKQLSEPMIVSLLTHVCVTWPQWAKQQRRAYA